MSICARSLTSTAAWLIYAHDIFLPFGMPIGWLRQQQIFWTEQYLLMALLPDTPRVRVRFSSAYHYAFHKDALERPICGRWLAGGGSFWFDYQGRLRIRAA
jgi:hypothetical protein